MRAWPWIAFLFAAAAACNDFKAAPSVAATAPDGEGGASDAGGESQVRDAAEGGVGDDANAGDSGGSSSDGAPGPHSDSGHGTGPGPFGALPTGYCCTADTECRNRNCGTANGVRMCLDRCEDDRRCDGGLPGFHCDGASPSGPGACKPIATMSTCVPAEQFTRGDKAFGECCTPTAYGTNGLECIGGLCEAYGNAPSNPFICTMACESATVCGAGAVDCGFLDYYRSCYPTADPYTCK